MPFAFKHGALTSNQQSSIRDSIDRYPYAILTSKAIDYAFTSKYLKEHEITEENDYGENYTRTSQLWSTFACTAGQLYFFKAKCDYDIVCQMCTDRVIDKIPFTTIIG